MPLGAVLSHYRYPGMDTWTSFAAMRPCPVPASGAREVLEQRRQRVFIDGMLQCSAARCRRENRGLVGPDAVEPGFGRS